MNITASELKTENERLYELDLLKALSIISMILCHAVFMLGAHSEGYMSDPRYIFGDHILGSYLGVAHAFMLSMGAGIVYSKKSSPKYLIKRGVSLYILAFILNFFRYGIYALAYGIISGEFMEETLYAFTSQDILHFAGLALVFTGLFKGIGLKEEHMLCIGVLLSAIGSFLAFRYTGSYAANYILGHFVVTDDECSCFVFFNWYLFVAAGMVLGKYLKRSGDKDAFYRRMLMASLPICIAYVLFTSIYGMFFLSKNNWYYAASPLEALGLLSIDMTLLSVFYFIQKRADKTKLAPFLSMSENVTKIYIIHWCILGFIDSIFGYLLEMEFPYTVIYAIGIVLIFVSAWIAIVWSKKQKAKAPQG